MLVKSIIKLILWVFIFEVSKRTQLKWYLQNAINNIWIPKGYTDFGPEFQIYDIVKMKPKNSWGSCR